MILGCRAWVLLFSPFLEKQISKSSFADSFADAEKGMS